MFSATDKKHICTLNTVPYVHGGKKITVNLYGLDASLEMLRSELL